MYVVTKCIEFCYGHRLLDYDGVCKHLHGHNARVEVDVPGRLTDDAKQAEKVLVRASATVTQSPGSDASTLDPLTVYRSDREGSCSSRACSPRRAALRTSR